MVYRTLTGPVFGLRREIDRLFEDTFGRDAGRSGAWSPAVDIREDNREIVLEVELPGIRPSDVEVTAENGVLTISGEKQSTTGEGNEGRYHMVERTYGTFLRAFQLPQGVDENRIEAEFVDGLLTVHVPKAALPQPRRIEIRNSGSQPVVQGTATRSSVKSGSSGSAQGAAGTTPADSLGAADQRRPAGGIGGNAESSAANRETSGAGSTSRTQSRGSR